MAETQKKPDIYIVTSCKGGIGKSTVTANLADTVARRGKRVLCIDCDYSNRSLDLLFGGVTPGKNGIETLVAGTSAPADSAIEVIGNALWFIPGPTSPVTFSAEAFVAAVERASDFFSCDCVFIDTPGASDGLLPVVTATGGTGIVVASHMPTAIRGAETTGNQLEKLGLARRLLIINRFDTARVLRCERLGVNELVDSTNLPLLGIVPDSGHLESAQESGRLVSSLRRDSDRCRAAFEEIAARLCGERVPLMSFYPDRVRKKLIDPSRKKKNDKE